MDLKILCLLVLVGGLSAEAEAKIMKDISIDHRGTILKDKLRWGKPLKADSTTRVVPNNEELTEYNRYKTSSPSSPVATASIKTCIATSSPPQSVNIGVYALRAAGGTVFLKHLVDGDVVDECLRFYRSDVLEADTIESCADRVESSDWANSFSFVEDVCEGYSAWRPSTVTQGTFLDGNFMVFIAENKINNFNVSGSALDVEQVHSVSRIFLLFNLVDLCNNVNKVEVSTQLRTQTYDNLVLGFPYFFDQFDIELCSLNPPVAAMDINITLYDYDGEVIEHVNRQMKRPGPAAYTVHRSSGEYGDLCVFQSSKENKFPTAAYNGYPCNYEVFSTAFRKTSFISFAQYKEIISTIPDVPSHFIYAYDDNGTWRWRQTNHAIEEDAFVSGAFPNTDAGKCLIANASESYFLEAAACSTPRTIVCVDFSALHYPASLFF